MSKRQSSVELEPPKKIKSRHRSTIKQHKIVPTEVASELLEEKQNEDKIVEANKQDYLLRKEHEEQMQLENIERIKKANEAKLKQQARVKKLLQLPLTYDHKGNVLVMQRTGNQEYDPTEDGDQERMQLQLEMRDKGVSDSHKMIKLAKIRFANDKRFLEDYLSMSDAKRYMEFTEDDFKNEWFSKYPDLIEPEEDIKEEEYFNVSEGVKYKNSKSQKVFQQTYHKPKNQMTIKEYQTLVGEKNLADRYATDQYLIKGFPVQERLKISRPERKISNQSSITHVTVKSYRSSNKNIGGSKLSLSRNTHHLLKKDKINHFTQDALKTLELKKNRKLNVVKSSAKSLFKSPSHIPKRITTPQILYREFIQQSSRNRVSYDIN